MRYSNAHIARVGVSAIRQIVEEHLAWIFRGQEKDDFGIDAFIEICDDGKPTGRLIAAQIKTGSSYFARKSKKGYIFTGNMRHLEYWESYSLPVILILYNPVDKQAFWTPVTQDLVELNEKSWKITIPYDACFNSQSINGIRKIAMPTLKTNLPKDALAQVFEHSNSSEIKVEGLIDVLNETGQCLDIASGVIDSTFARLIKLLSYRIKIRLLSNLEFCKDIKWVNTAPGIKVRYIPPKYGVLHSKLMILDETMVLYGSANLTELSWGENNEMVLANTKTHVVDKYLSEFNRVWKASISI